MLNTRRQMIRLFGRVVESGCVRGEREGKRGGGGRERKGRDKEEREG